MLTYARDVSVSVMAGLLVLAITTYAAMEDVPPERAERHMMAAALGDHAELAMNLEAGQAGGGINHRTPRVFPTRENAAAVGGPEPSAAHSSFLPTGPEYLERLALREYERAGMTQHAPWLLAQIRAESAWRPDAGSPVGAVGLAQFMPPTADEEYPRTEPSCEGVARTDPTCSLRAQAGYMQRVARWVDDPGNFHLASAGYNAGAKWIQRETDACAAAFGCDPTKWFNNVSRHCQRAAHACQETRGYLKRIAEFAQVYRDRRVSGTITW